LLALSVVAAPAAQATDVDGARSQVQELGREVEVAAEEYNDVRVQLQSQKDRVQASETRVSSQAQAIDAMTAQLGALAVETFKRGGVDPQLAVVLGDPGQFATSTSTLTLMAERRSTSLTDLKDAQEELVRLEASAAAELEAVQAMEADLAERKTAIEARLSGAEDVLAAAEAEAARIEAARRAAEERATRSREAAEAAAAVQAAAPAGGADESEDDTASSTSSGSGPASSTSSSPTRSSSRSGSGGSSSSSSGGSASGGSSGTSSGGSASAGAEFTAAGTINCAGTSVDVPDDRVATVLGFACAQMGKPYKWGSSGPSSYDCSGLTSAAWAQAGVSLPHSSKAQAGYGTRVSRGNLRPGDLVFNFSPISHVGIYIGGGRMVAAPSAGDVVKIQSLEYLPFNTAVRL